MPPNGRSNSRQQPYRKNPIFLRFVRLFVAMKANANARPMKPRKKSRPSRAATEFRYEKLTWPEINDAVDLGKVCVVPCGAVEQHGAHLPLDVDMICPTGIARGAGAIIADKMLVLP